MRNKTADELMKLANDTSIEATLLTRKLIRNLNKELGMPAADDFPNAYKRATYWRKQPGYTTHMEVTTQQDMANYNKKLVAYNVKRPSERKRAIVDDYLRDGWSITIQAYNVMCSMYIRHPRYTNVAVKFFMSRNCSKYEYVLVRE